MRPPSVEIVLEPLVGHTGYAPLAVLGYWLRRTKFLAPLWTPLDWSIKTYMHTPVDKLETLFVSLLAGNRAVSQRDTTIRPDSALTQAWGQTQFAEQSTVAEMLNHVCEADLTQLQQGSASLFRRHSQALQHPFAHQWLLVDYDSTGLLISKSAEGSEKGYFSGHRNRYGRQLVRLSAPSYHETLWSALYAGNTHAFATLKETVAAFEQLLPQAQQHRSHIIFRSDAGIGTDANSNWLLWRGYHVLAKGFSQTRAAAQARQVAPAAWCQDGDADRWVASAPRPARFGRRTEMYIVRWPTQQGFRYSTLISSVPGLSPLSTLHLYDGRGAMEIEIRADKQGLRLPKHHKRSLAAQMVLILLTDSAHNLLS